jgi:hypothetical protein
MTGGSPLNGGGRASRLNIALKPKFPVQVPLLAKGDSTCIHLHSRTFSPAHRKENFLLDPAIPANGLLLFFAQPPHTIEICYTSIN